MIEETKKKIEELLELKGIIDNSVLEEMVDHYLTEFEVEKENGASDLHAARIVYQSIANINVKQINNGAKKNYSVASALFIFLFFLGILSWSMYNEPAPSKLPIEDTTNFISANFGKSYHPIQKRVVFHKGIDIVAPLGDEVYAPKDGTVSDTGYDKLKGNYIIIKHNQTYTTKYFHLSSTNVKLCQKITKGDIIGKVGSSGLSTAPHLHYELLENGQAVDPMAYLEP